MANPTVMKDHNSNSPTTKVNMTSSSSDAPALIQDQSEFQVIPTSVPVPTSISSNTSASTTPFPVNKAVTKHVTYGDSTVVFMTPEQSPMTPDIGVKELLASEMNRSPHCHRGSPPPPPTTLASKTRESPPSRMPIQNNNYNNNNNNNYNTTSLGSTTDVVTSHGRSGSTSPGSRQHHNFTPGTNTDNNPSEPRAATDREYVEPTPNIGVHRARGRSPTPPPVVMRTSATSLDRLSWRGYRPPSEEYYDVLHPEPKDQT